MKRTVAALLMLLLLVPAQPLAGAARTPQIWDTDRTLRLNLTIPGSVDLEIGPGVNISFEPDRSGAVFSPVALNVAGGFEVCGTANSQVVFRASNESIYALGELGGELNIGGNGDPRQISVRNCSFQNLSLYLDGPAGEFRDCTFYSSYLYISDSAAMFFNCSFLRSVVSILNPATLNRTRLSGCEIDSLSRERWDPFWDYFNNIAAVKVSGYASIENCTITGYGIGILSSSGLPDITGCLVTACQDGIALTTTDPADTPRVEGCVVQNCRGYALIASGNLLLLNCTLSNSSYGLELSDLDILSVPNWTLAGNRIFGNRHYGVVLNGEELLLGDTRFDDGAGLTNQQGRVVKRSDLLVEISTRGSGSVPNADLNLTDAFGIVTNGYRLSASLFLCPNMMEYVVDNSGQRQDFYPYTVRAEWMGIFCETVVSAGTRKVTLVLAILPDLVPFGITLDPPFPRAGDYVAISCAVNNTGPMPSSWAAVLFTLDGERLDESELFPLGPRSQSNVRALDWKARRGTHTVTVRIDPQNDLEEDDETNNNLTFNFTVREGPARAPANPATGYAQAATILVLACAGGYLVVRRRKRAKEA